MEEVITNKQTYELSKEARFCLNVIRTELATDVPDYDLIFEALSGTKYSVKIGRP